MYQINYMNMFEQMNDAIYLWYKLCCYYHAKTELYDRMLTDLRSPYDPTEAYVQGIERSFSNAYARKIRRFIGEVAIGISENIKSIGLNCGKYRYSAQDWIDEYNRLEANGEMDFINELKQKIADSNKKEYVRGYRANVFIWDDVCDVPQEIIDEVCKPFIRSEE